MSSPSRNESNLFKSGQLLVTSWYWCNTCNDEKEIKISTATNKQVGMGAGCTRRLLSHLREGRSVGVNVLWSRKIACETGFVWIDSKRSARMVIWESLYSRQFVDINVALRTVLWASLSFCAFAHHEQQDDSTGLSRKTVTCDYLLLLTSLIFSTKPSKRNISVSAFWMLPSRTRIWRKKIWGSQAEYN